MNVVFLLPYGPYTVRTRSVREEYLAFCIVFAIHPYLVAPAAATASVVEHSCVRSSHGRTGTFWFARVLR